MSKKYQVLFFGLIALILYLLYDLNQQGKLRLPSLRPGAVEWRVEGAFPGFGDWSLNTPIPYRPLHKDGNRDDGALQDEQGERRATQRALSEGEKR